MDTERYLSNEEDLLRYCVELTEEDTTLLMTYLCFDKRIQMLNQQYNMMQCTFDMIQDYYDIDANDVYKRKRRIGEFDDRIALNVLVSNYLAMAKEFAESIEVFIKVHLENEGAEFKKTYMSTVYDKIFSYRFLQFIRNFSQHGDLSVSVRDGRCCFDLLQIFHNEHYNFREKKIVPELRRIIEEEGVNARVAVILSLITQLKCLHSIYISLLECVRETAVELQENLQSVFRKNKNAIVKHESLPNGGIVFCHDDVAHVIKSTTNVVCTICNYRTAAVEHLKEVTYMLQRKLKEREYCD